MGRKCIVLNCPNSTRKPLRPIHLFPVHQPIRKKWTDSLKGQLKDVKLENSGVCSFHFRVEDYTTNTVDGTLRPTAVPQSQRMSGSLRCDLDIGLTQPDLRSNDDYPVLDENEINAPVSTYITELENRLQESKKIIMNKNKLISKKNKIITELKSKCADLVVQLELYQSQSNIANATKKILSEKQIQKLINPDSLVHWNDSDIAKAISLDSVSSKCYKYVRNTLNYPLPSRSTIKRWLKQIEVKPGILHSVLKLMNASFENSTLMQRTGTLAIDEMAIDERMCYDAGDDRICGGSDQMLGTFIRGTFGDWKQIVHFSFHEKFDRSKLFEIIQHVENSGIRICSMVSDMGTKNQALWKELDIGRVVNGEITSFSFPHPFDDSRNIFVFPDYPHLLKLLRSHLIDTKITLPDGVIVDKSLILSLLDVQRHELKLTHSLTQKHISVRGKQRMKVRPAFQLFSSKVANAIRVAFPKKKSEAEFFEHINNFSDLMNTRTKPDNYSTVFKTAYGAKFKEQNMFLSKFYNYFCHIRVGNRKEGSYAPFQKGFLIAIRSLIGLFHDMSKTINAKYLMTARLNQDYVENSFGIIRGAGGFNMKPDQVQSMARVKKIIVGKRFNTPLATNTQSADEQSFISSTSLRCLMSVQSDGKFPVRNTPFSDSFMEEIAEIDTDIEIKDITWSDLTLYEKCEEGGREYVAGFIADKLKEKYPLLARVPAERTAENALWVRLLQEGGLVEPSSLWFSYFRKFDEYFEAFHPGGKINREPDIVKRFANVLSTHYPSVPERVINLYSRTRTMIRIANMNKEAENRKFIFQERRRNMTQDEDECHEQTTGKASEESLEELLELLDS